MEHSPKFTMGGGDSVGEGAGKRLVGSIMLEFFFSIYLYIYYICWENVFRKETGKE